MLARIIQKWPGAGTSGGAPLTPGERPVVTAQRYLTEARKHIEQAREEKAKNLGLGLAKAEYAKAEEAFTNLKEWLKKAPDFPEKNSLFAQAYLERGDALREQKLFKAARASYKKAYQYSPTEAQQKLDGLPSSKSATGSKDRHLSYPSSAIPMVSAVSTSLVLPTLTLSTIQPMTLTLTVFFEQNPPPISSVIYPVTATVTTIEAITNTHQLAVSLQQIDLPDEQKAMRRALVFDVLDAFARSIRREKTEEESSASIQEIIPLTTIPDREIYRQLIKAPFNAFYKENLLNTSALQGLAVIVHRLLMVSVNDGRDRMSVGDLVQLLKSLFARLSTLHREGNTVQLQMLLQTIAQLLDAMVRVGVSGISREQLQEPLDQLLQAISQSENVKNVALAYQARYAQQALVRLANDESYWQAGLRRVLYLAEGTATLTNAIRNLDPTQLLPTFRSFQQAFSGTGELLHGLPRKGLPALGQGVSGLRQALWYDALQFLDLLREENQFVQFKQWAELYVSQVGADSDFLLGLCERLEQIAQVYPNPEMQQQAILFLANLVQQEDKNPWGKHPQVRQAVIAALQRLARRQSGSLFAYAQAILNQNQVAASHASQPLPLAPLAPLTEASHEFLRPVWDPAWQSPSQTSTVLLSEARITQQHRYDEQRQYLPLANLGKEIERYRENSLRTLKKDDEFKDAVIRYVALEGTTTLMATERFDLNGAVTDFLKSDKKVLLLLGEAGSGKSTFLRHLGQQLWKRYTNLAASNDPAIPIFISLPTLNDPHKNLINDYLKDQNFKKEEIDALRQHRHFVFILDGYDEIAYRHRAFYKNNKLDQWQAKIIISSRPEYLGPGYQSKFHPPRQPQLFQEVRLAPFSNDAVQRYIKNYVDHLQNPQNPQHLQPLQKNAAYSQSPQWTVEQYQRALEQAAELKALMGNPFLLRIALEVLPELGKAALPQANGPRFTRVALYDRFVENWFERSNNRLASISLTEPEKEAFDSLCTDEGFNAHGLHFCQQLAVAMFQAQLVIAIYSVFDTDTSAQSDWRMTFLGNDDAKKRLLRFNAPLIRHGDQYRFIHKSSQDYFVARAICPPDFKPVSPGPTGWLNQLDLINERSILDFLADRVKQSPEFKAHLFAWANASKHLEVQQGAANALTILNCAQAPFSREDFRGIRAPRANLTGAICDGTQFQGENTDLREVILRGAWLRQAKFDGAKLAGIVFGEKPFLQFDEVPAACCYSLDGTLLAVATGKQVRLYEAAALTLLHVTEAHDDCIWCIAFSPNSEWLVTGSRDHTLTLWQIDAYPLRLRPLLTRSTEAKIKSVAVSPDGAFLAVAAGTQLQLYDTKTLEPLAIQDDIFEAETDSSFSAKNTDNGKAYSLAFSPNGQWLASGGQTAKLLEFNEGTLKHRQTLKVDAKKVTCVRFSPDSTRLVLACSSYTTQWEYTLQLWAIGAEPTRLETVKAHGRTIRCVEFSTSGRWLATGSEDEMVKVWEISDRTLKIRHRFEGHRDWVTGLTFSPDEQWLASSSGSEGRVGDMVMFDNEGPVDSTSTDRTVRVQAIAESTFQYTATEPISHSKSLDCSPDGQLLAVAAGTRIRLHDSKNLACVGIFDERNDQTWDRVWSVAFSRNGQWLASCREDEKQTIKLWKVTGQTLTLCRTLADESSIWKLAFSPDSQWLVSCSMFDEAIKLWPVETNALPQAFTAHSQGINGIDYSPNGQWLASGSLDNTVVLWEVAEGKATAVRIFTHDDGVEGTAFSPNSAYLASCSHDKLVKLWDVMQRELLYALAGHTDIVWEVAFSPDNELLASASADRTVRLWLVASGECLAVIRGFHHEVYAVVWQKNLEDNKGDWLLTSSKDKAVRRWQVTHTGDHCEVHLCQTSIQTILTADEASIESVQGLSSINERLLRQRGAQNAPAVNLQTLSLESSNLILA